MKINNAFKLIIAIIERIMDASIFWSTSIWEFHLKAGIWKRNTEKLSYSMLCKSMNSGLLQS